MQTIRIAVEQVECIELYVPLGVLVTVESG